MNSEEELHEEEWLKRIRQAANAFELEPAEDSWQRIEQGLKRRRRRKGWAIAATWLLILGAGSATWWMMHRSPAGRLAPNEVITHPSLAGSESASSASSSSGKTVPPQTHLSASTPQHHHRQSQPLHQSGKASSQWNISVTSTVQKPAVKQKPAPLAQASWPSLAGISLSPYPEQLRHPRAVLQLPPGWGLPVRQKDTAPSATPLSFHIAFAPGVGYRQLVQQGAASPSVAQSFMRRPANNYIPSSALGHDPAFSYLASVEVQTTLRRGMVIGSGVQLLAFQYHIQAVNLSGAAYTRNANPMTTTSGTPAQLSTVYGAYNPNALLAPDQYTTLVNQQVNVELPVFMGYRSRLFRNIQWQITGGAGLDVVLHQQQYVYVPAYQRYVADDQQLRRWNVSALLSGSFIVPVGRGQLFMGPDLHYQLLNAYRHQPHLKENLYLVSWKIGVIP